MPTAPPAPGTIGRGELLVDAQTRTLWLGVDASVDPAQAILISDIQTLMDDIVALDASLRAYVDAGLATKSNVGHSHTHADITDWDDAIEEAVSSVPPFCVIIYTGLVSTIPVGFVICDGLNGTPNLVNKFVLCAGSTGGTTVPPGQQGGTWTYGAGNSAQTTDDGDHAHGSVTANWTLTIAQMPQHDHGYNNLSNGVALGHHHGYLLPQESTIGYAAGGNTITVARSPYVGAVTDTVGTNIDILDQGGGQAHAHGISQSGAHHHKFQVETASPYYALAYIMKLP